MIVTRIGNQGKGRQLHNRQLHIWRWEYVLYRFIGINWQDMSLNREDWKNKVGEAKYKATKGIRVTLGLSVVLFVYGSCLILLLPSGLAGARFR